MVAYEIHICILCPFLPVSSVKDPFSIPEEEELRVEGEEPSAEHAGPIQVFSPRCESPAGAHHSKPDPLHICFPLGVELKLIHISHFQMSISSVSWWLRFK